VRGNFGAVCMVGLHRLFDGLTIHRLTPRASFIFIRCNKSSLQCNKMLSADAGLPE
jgi:hypothetical protein